MGRLNIIVGLLALAIFLMVRPVLGQMVGTVEDPEVGVETVDGYSQIFYINNGEKIFVTSGNVNNKMPLSVGKHLVYVAEINGAGQIMLYDLETKVKTQLTYVGTNLNPKVSLNGDVVWEGWDGNTWQIFLFSDGVVKQLTEGDTSLNPSFSDDGYISYGRRDIAGTWRGVVYSLPESKSIDIAVGEKTKNIKIRNGEIYLFADTRKEEKFALSVEDLFLLDLKPLRQESNEDLFNELLTPTAGTDESSLIDPDLVVTPESVEFED